MKKVAILQSNYIPWKGYFDIINSVDEFVLFDEVQYTKRDWRNRNKIKTPNGSIWLTIPVNQEKYEAKISEIKVSDAEWAEKHWKSITHNYSKTPFFKMYKTPFEEFYLQMKPGFLSDINSRAIQIINGILNIKTKISSSADFQLVDGKNERLIQILRQSNATHYLSGPAAKDYLDESLFNKESIEVMWMDYNSYPEYQQLYPPFTHYVSVLDLIFNTGPDAMKYISAQ